MQLPPVEVLASWPTPNYYNPTDVRGPELLIISGIFFPLAFLMVAIRVFTRLRISRAFGADDIFLLVATVPAVGCAVLTGLAVTRRGWNRHIWDVPLDLVTLGLKLTIAMEVLFATAVSCTKMSLLILTRRIMSSGTGYLRHVATAGMLVVACEGIIFTMVVIFACSPVQAYWTLSFTPQKCINEKIHLFIGGTINTLTDFLVFFIPIPTVLGLKIHRRQQVLLCLLFGAGAIVCAAGVVRLYYTWKTTSTYDRTWVSYPLWVSAMLELSIGIICAALPACKPFFSRYIPVILSSSYHGSKHSEYVGQQNLSQRSNPRKPSFLKGESVLFPTARKPSSPIPWELQLSPMSKSAPRIRSKLLLPVSFLDSSSPSSEIKNKRILSTQKSISCFIAAGESSTPSISSYRPESPWHSTPWERGQAAPTQVDRAGSGEGLTRGISNDGFT